MFRSGVNNCRADNTVRSEVMDASLSVVVVCGAETAFWPMFGLFLLLADDADVLFALTIVAAPVATAPFWTTVVSTTGFVVIGVGFLMDGVVVVVVSTTDDGFAVVVVADLLPLFLLAVVVASWEELRLLASGVSAPPLTATLLVVLACCWTNRIASSDVVVVGVTFVLLWTFLLLLLLLRRLVAEAAATATSRSTSSDVDLCGDVVVVSLLFDRFWFLCPF
jgi:hypothetical protein